MNEVAQAIKVFPIQEEPPSNENAAVLVPLETLQALLKGLQSLNQEVKDLKARLNSLEALEEVYHGPAPKPEETTLLRDYWTKRREVLNDLPSRVWGIEEDLSALEKAVHKNEPKPPGKKTAARIEKLKEILKQNGGSRAFSQLQNDLDLDPSQFSQLVNKLDKRVFEISRRPGTKRGEKILKLKARIREPLIFR
jgi:DNA repair exonuclease SbcCD ATPase subunit